MPKYFYAFFFKLFALYPSCFTILHLTIILMSLINLYEIWGDIILNILNIAVSLMRLLNRKVKILPSREFFDFLFNVTIVSAFIFQKSIKINQVIVLSFLQFFYSLKYRWKGWAFIAQFIMIIKLFYLEGKNEFEWLNFITYLVIFFMFTGLLKIEKSDDQNFKRKSYFEKISKLFYNSSRKVKKEIDQQKSDFLDYISDALVFFNPKSGRIIKLNSKAKTLYSAHIPLTINELPFWPLFSSPSEPTSSTIIENQTTISSVPYNVSLHNISSSLSILVIGSTICTHNSNNLKMLSYVAHEFRSPLNCINTMLDALIKIAPENMRESYILPARDSLECLLVLVNDLLDMSQMMAGKFSLSLSDFKLRQVTKNVVALMCLQAELKGIKVIYEEIGDVPTEINSDPARLRQVMINLMSNAMKYTSHGWIKLKVVSLRPNFFEISVADTGVGIRKEDQSKLLCDFGRIMNLEDQKLNNYGVGLGLIISDALSRELSGDSSQGLHLVSEWGKGSTFTFYIKDFNETDCRFKEVSKIPTIPKLPDARRESVKIEQSLAFLIPTSHKSFGTLRKIRTTSFEIVANENVFLGVEQPKKKCNCADILICDDNHFNILSLQLQLKNLGKTCDTASLGEIAIKKVIEKLQEQCCKYYKMIFMDLEMPALSGCETSKQIKEVLNYHADQTKIIAFSGYDAIEEKKKALLAGMEEFLVKPVMESELKKILEKNRDLKKIRTAT